MKTALTLILLVASLYITGGEQKPNVTDEEIEMLLDRHNAWRAEVGVPAVKWSDQLAVVADQWARTLNKQSCAWKHSQNGYGENLFRGTVGAYTAADAVDAWGSEKLDYNYAKNKCKPGKVCGHYTQMVWKGTTEVGCAKTICEGYVVWVCNYDPPGNWVGQKPY